jgi:hypothetical protein
VDVLTGVLDPQANRRDTRVDIIITRDGKISAPYVFLNSPPI